MIHDISPLISQRTAVWPGDHRPEQQFFLDASRGDPVTVSSIHATVHLGAHADAPSHFKSDADSIERCSLENYLGPCEVVRVDVPRGGLVTPMHFHAPPAAPRVLIATGTFHGEEQFNTDFAALTLQLVDWFHGHHIRLLGIDTPSIDPYSSKDLPSHHACHRCGISILEGLDLRQVRAGLYELIALPLRLKGFDASPVRAVLRSSDPPSHD